MKIRKPWLAVYAASFLCTGAQATTPGVDFVNGDPVKTATEEFASSNPSPAVGQAAAQDADPCSKNKELEARFYLFLYGDPKRNSDSLSVLFNYSSCSVSDRGGAHNEPIGPRATRAYIAKNPENPGGYNFLWIETIGGSSRFFIGQKEPDTGRTAQTYIAEVSNTDILNGIVKLQNVFISDARAHRDGFIGTLFITLTSPHKDGPIADPSIKPGPIPDSSITTYRGKLYIGTGSDEFPLCFELSSGKKDRYPTGADQADGLGGKFFYQGIPIFQASGQKCASYLDIDDDSIRDCDGRYLVLFTEVSSHLPNEGSIMAVLRAPGTDRLDVKNVGAYHLQPPVPGDRCR